MALPSRNSPPPIRMRSRPEISLSEHGEQRRGQPDDPGDRQQQQDAHDHGGEQAGRAAPCACCAAGSLPTRIEMKMTLSTPRTISRNVSVTSARRPSKSGTAKRVRSSVMAQHTWYAVCRVEGLKGRRSRRRSPPTGVSLRHRRRCPPFESGTPLRNRASRAAGRNRRRRLRGNPAIELEPRPRGSF